MVVCMVLGVVLVCCVGFGMVCGADVEFGVYVDFGNVLVLVLCFLFLC